MLRNYPSQVRIVDVSPRDGLQNIKNSVPTEVKTTLINKLCDAGIQHIEVASFVSPKWVPQMADAEAVLQQLPPREGTSYIVLTPNLRGFERAIDSGAKEVAIFAAASETFSQKNTNCSIAQSLEHFEPIMLKAAALGVRVRGYTSCVLGCPYEGDIAVAEVVRVSKALIDMGCYEVSLGDTIGIGTPIKAREMIAAVIKAVPAEKLALHFHDTRGQALANILACLEYGVANIDASVAGLGGCPYAAGASGNVSTEDVVYMLHGMGIETGIDLKKLVAAGHYISEQIAGPNLSKVGAVYQ
ncbi:hydroxymethylglutaryl-CoA lyase [Cycloclasticus zancles]|jgi:hydroxymethylglutaryl-CoA lyase|uniref:hydroxymethylglutaryl-CoA lyase n=1 Tax=Cycloclasticus zancles 78-ME TaxID=1198232 RepID=S5T6W2_9GAMM|nr:hydroxymethylglutaryl-CoA lyase [Cycloclasticus zancles]AGS39521.1 Hydroxymethylglutaryl-CoA lyase [Cycloclasticus zancles 78-ME]